MKVIFCDIDGVLNHRKAFEMNKAPTYRVIDRDCLDQLRRVIEETGCDVVLSSTWRKDRRDVEWLKRKLKLRFIGYTPILEARTVTDPDYCRGDEIQQWLTEHPEVDKYAIIDDDGDMLDSQRPFFVQTSFDQGGLTTQHANRLIEILGKDVPNEHPSNEDQ